MKLSISILSILVLTSTGFSGSTVVASATEACTGPFRQCAYEVQATCSRDANGQQRMTYWDHPGYTMRFEQCVGRVFEASGRPNPYATGVASYRGMTVPYTELLYPMERGVR